MATPLETRTVIPRELNFYGEGKAESIKRGFAVVSLRNPRPDYAFERGEHILANCKDDGEKVPVVVIANDQQRLNKFDIPVLALDGSFSAEEAAEMLRSGGYPGYELTTIRSSLQAIAFVHEDGFCTLTPNQQTRLTTNQLSDLMHDKDFRHLFFPTMAYWLTERDMGITEWSNFLEFFNLVNTQEIEKMKNFEVKGIKIFSLLKGNPEALQKLALNSNSELFSPIILDKFVGSTE